MTNLDQILARYSGAETFKFGDSSVLSAQLLSLVASGVKTATCGTARHFGSGGEPMPVTGRCDIALHWNGQPAIVIQTVEATRCRFCDIDAYFALAEGENDTLEGWRRDHRAFFEREGEFDRAMDLICERFKVVEVLP